MCIRDRGDSTLKGAVYGLYAREDIVYPDGATGTIYKAGEQVTSLTTNDKGQASVNGLYLSLIHISYRNLCGQWSDDPLWASGSVYVHQLSILAEPFLWIRTMVRKRAV